MKAAICTEYGTPDVIQIREVEKPVAKPNEILVKVKVTTVTSGDARIRGSIFPDGFKIPGRLALGIFAPRFKVLGSEFSGVVEEVGSNVTKFSRGDEVVGFRVFNVHAEYLTIKEDAAVIKKPESLSFEEAAALPFGGSTALFFLEKAKLKKGESILINGASGAVGIMAVQIAKAFGANVTAVCGTDNIELVKSLGADTIIDYKKEAALKGNLNYDVIMDTVGNMDFKTTQKFLKQDGRFIELVSSLVSLIFGSKGEKGKVKVTGTAPETKDLLNKIIELYANNQLKAVIGKKFEFEKISQAHAYVDTKHKVGSAIVVVS